ncbi:MAG: 6-phosphofructokinase [Planctomycetaceae bacterium]|jgi:6-phosphofructokinase 1|nr:6-phosphofructokinase [Planctomycetaceae bacterium]
MRIGILCSGGDAPGMNPCLRAIVRAAVSIGDEALGIMHGYEGLMNEEFYTQPDGTVFMGLRSVSGLSNIGGTILHSSRSQRFTTEEGLKCAANVLQKYHIDALIPIGGNGTLTGALELSKVWNGQIIGLPGTIDNDLLGTDYTIGFETAVHTAVEAVDKLHDTAGSHDMMFFVEVMGRHCGDVALHAAIASGSEIVCVPEIPTDPENIIKHLYNIKKRGKTSVLAIVAEGDDSGGATNLRQKLIATGECPYDSRVVILGHIQRGGIPVPFDRILATTLGVRAVDALHEGETGKMVGLINNKATLSPLEEVICGHRCVDTNMIKLLQIMAN